MAILQTTAPAEILDEKVVVPAMPPEIIPDGKLDIIKEDSENLSRNLKEDLRTRELIETDLTRKKLFKVVSEALGAEKVTINEDGVEICREPDHELRLKAAREAREILGETALPSKGRVMPNIVVVLANGRRVG